MSDLDLEYLKPGGRLPRGGPDRVRMCFWYADEMAKGHDHREALEGARCCLRLLHWYCAAGIADKLGTHAGGVDVRYLGEDMAPPQKDPDA